MRHETVLSPSEVEILQKSRNDPSIFSDYFFRPPGYTKGWIFDDKFVEEGKWQKTVCMAFQKDITIVGGFGTGKTVGIGMGACYWACLLTDFKFLNAAPKQWQAKQMYDLIISHARNTRFDDLIWEKPRRPYPKVVLRFRIGKVLYESTLEFMSADKEAQGILSWEGDWLNIEEAGLMDNLEEVIINTGSRLRGQIRGRTRLGRFSMISNSWDNYELWSYFDQAETDPDNFLSIAVSTRHNKNVTEEQFQRMLLRIPKEERQRFLDATRPEGRGNYFDKDCVYACESQVLDELVTENIEKETPGYVLEKVHGAGVYHYRIPPRPKSLYLLIGDPGVGTLPRRNAPTIGLFEVSQFPKQPAVLHAFWWGSGNGRIGPFVDMMLELAEIYRPFRIYIDSTSTQKNMTYLINEYVFKKKFEMQESDGNPLVTEHGFESPLGIVKGFSGLDFSGSGKNMYLQALRMYVEAGLFSWPRSIVGIRSQLTNYDLERDRKIPQDIVAMMSMAAYAIRANFHVDLEELLNRDRPKIVEAPVGTRRSSGEARTRRSPQAHQTFR